MAIETQADADAATERVVELSSKSKAPEEKAEMVDLIDDVNGFRATQAANLSATKTITTLDEYERATQRIADLKDFAEGTLQAAEMAALVARVMEWDKTHDDATRWQ